MSQKRKRPSDIRRDGKKRKRRSLILVLGLAAIAISTALAAWHYRKPTPQPASFYATESAPRYARLDAIVEKAKIGVRGEPDAEQLLDDFAKNAMVGKLVSYGQVVYATRHDVLLKKAALFILVSEKELKFVPDHMPTNFLFAPQIQAIVFADLEPMNDETLAGILIHELFHWRVFLRNGRKIDTEPYSQKRLEEEVFAHELEIRATDRLTNGTFIKTINAVLADDKLSGKDGTGLRGFTRKGLELILGTWPNKPLSQTEYETRVSNAAISFRLLQIPTLQERVIAYAKIRRENTVRDIR